jgi:hypothetical protein
VCKKEWDEARRLLALGRAQLHDLRHVAGTLAAATGAAQRRSGVASATPRGSAPLSARNRLTVGLQPIACRLAGADRDRGCPMLVRKVTPGSRAIVGALAHKAVHR